MARSMWKGAIAFGLVNIPIELYSATRDHRPKFRMLHAKDESPVHFERDRDNLMRIIEGKLKGRRPKLRERETRQSGDVVDLMARLRASLESKGPAGKTARAGSGAKKSGPSRKRSGHAA